MSVSPTLPTPGILTCDDLMRATGFERVGDMRRALDGAGIRYFFGRGGKVWTTMDLVNAAGGLMPTSGQSDGKLRPEDIFL